MTYNGGCSDRWWHQHYRGGLNRAAALTCTLVVGCIILHVGQTCVHCWNYSYCILVFSFSQFPWTCSEKDTFFSMLLLLLKERGPCAGFVNVNPIKKKGREEALSASRRKECTFGESPFDSDKCWVLTLYSRLSHLKIVQYLAWCLGFGSHLNLSTVKLPCFFCFCANKLKECVSLLDLSCGDLLKVDIVAAAVDLVVLHVPVLQLQTQFPHHSLEVPVSTVHLDVVLLQLFLVTNYLDGGK